MSGAEYIINRRLRGRTPQELIEEFEYTDIDLKYIRSSLLKDLRTLEFTVLPEDVKVDEDTRVVRVSLIEEVLTKSSIKIRSVIDTYVRTYPELEFVLGSKF